MHWSFLFVFSFFLIIFYWLYYYSCPGFLPLLPSTQHPPFSQAIHTPLFISKGNACKFFGYPISYTVLYIPMAISSVHFYNISSVYCFVCSPPKVKSFSITIYPPLPSSNSPFHLAFPLVTTILLSLFISFCFFKDCIYL